jgi:hypothetical protein
VGYHQFHFGVLGFHVVAFGFVWFVGCGWFECSCWGGSSVVCWSAIIVVRCGCFRDVSEDTTDVGNTRVAKVKLQTNSTSEWKALPRDLSV